MTRLVRVVFDLRVAALFFWSLLPNSISSFSPSEHAKVTRSRLSQAFSSPSGKLTFSPEIVIPEPSDLTAILLQTNSIQNLSEKIRKCKANAAFVKGSMTALQTFANEQEAARGSFPGPVPLVYCGDDLTAETIQDIADAGVDGVVIQVCGGKQVSSPDEIAGDNAWQELCQAALAHGIQPIPEVTIGEETTNLWDGEALELLVNNLCMGIDPVSVLLTVNAADDEQEEPVQLPTVPKELGKKIPILGSVRVIAGENRLGEESQRFKDAGFTGTFLRSDCVPGFRINLNMEAVGIFWSHCIDDLKSTKSKSFSFRSKNNMEKNLATKWTNYQNSVLESGALGDPNDSYSIVDDSAGEYKGFA